MDSVGPPVGRPKGAPAADGALWVVTVTWAATVVLVAMALVLLAKNGPAPSFARLAARRSGDGLARDLGLCTGAAVDLAVLLPVVPRRSAARGAVAAGRVAGRADSGDGDRRAGLSHRSAGGPAVCGQPARRVWDGGTAGEWAAHRRCAVAARGGGGLGRVADRPSTPSQRRTAPAAQVVRQCGGARGRHRGPCPSRPSHRPDRVGRRGPGGAGNCDRLPAGVGWDRDPAVPPV